MKKKKYIIYYTSNTMNREKREILEKYLCDDVIGIIEGYVPGKQKIIDSIQTAFPGFLYVQDESDYDYIFRKCEYIHKKTGNQIIFKNDYVGLIENKYSILRCDGCGCIRSYIFYDLETYKINFKDDYCCIDSDHGYTDDGENYIYSRYPRELDYI